MVQLSAGVVFREIDLTTIIPAVSTSTGAMAGVFGWGPVGEIVSIGSEPILVQTLGAPTNLNPETWFTCANFLSYTNSLLVVRAANTTGATPYLSFAALGANSTVATVCKIPSELATDGIELCLCQLGYDIPHGALYYTERTMQGPKGHVSDAASVNS